MSETFGVQQGESVMPSESSTDLGENTALTVLQEQTRLELSEWENGFFNGQEISLALRQEIANRVKIRKVNNMWVCFYADDTSDSEGSVEKRAARSRHQGEILKYFVDNSNTEGVMIEYFAPELKYNTRNSSPLAKPFIRQHLHDPKYKDRIFGFNYLASLAKRSGKDVYVADIANKPAYQALRAGWGYTPGATAAIALSHIDSPLALAGSAVGGGILSAIVQETISRVTPNKNKLENIIPTPEDARRVFIARGIREVTRRLNDHPETNKNGTLLVVYPEAHINRILDYLDNGSRKERLYKSALPGLDYHIRRYSVAKEPDQASRELSGWQLVEEMPI